MTNQANNLDRDLRELFHLGAEFIDLEPSRAGQALARAKRRILRNVVIAAAALALIGLGTVEISRTVSTDNTVRRTPADTNSPTGLPARPADVVADIEVGGNPPFVAAGGGYLWVLDGSSRAILRVDPNSHAITRIPFEGLLIGHPAVGFGSLWVANPDVSPSSGAPQQTRSSDAPIAPKEPSQPPRPSPWLQRIDLGTGVATGIALPEGADPYQVVAGKDALWVGDAGGRLYRVDPDTNAIVATVDVGGDLSRLVSFDGRIWAFVDDGSEATLRAIDPATNKVDQSIGLGFSTFGIPPTGLVGGDGSLWLTACLPGLPDCTWNVLRIDPGTGTVTAQVVVGELRNGIVDGGDGTTRAAVVADNAGRVWVLANTGNYFSPQQDASGQLLAIDPASNQVVSTIDFGPGYPYDLAFDGVIAWIVDLAGGRLVAIQP